MDEIEISIDSTINELIQCIKVFRGKPASAIEKNRNSSQRFNIYGQGNGCKFTVFIKQSLRMPEKFSVGLIYANRLLIRVNGFHGTTKAGFYTAEHHKYPHEHILTIEDASNGRGTEPSHINDLTGNYVDLTSCLLYFFDRCNIIGYDKYFEFRQLSLFD